MKLVIVLALIATFVAMSFALPAEESLGSPSASISNADDLDTAQGFYGGYGGYGGGWGWGRRRFYGRRRYYGGYGGGWGWGK